MFNSVIDYSSFLNERTPAELYSFPFFSTKLGLNEEQSKFVIQFIKDTFCKALMDWDLKDEDNMQNLASIASEWENRPLLVWANIQLNRFNEFKNSPLFPYSEYHNEEEEMKASLDIKEEETIPF